MQQLDILKPTLPATSQHLHHWVDLHGDSLSLALAMAAKSHRAPLLVVTTDNQTASQLEYDLQFFYQGELEPPTITRFPDWETLPYDQLSPHQDIISQRLKVLHDLPMRRQGIIIVPMTSLMHRLAPRRYIEGNTLIFQCGEKLDQKSFRQRLQQNGYRHVNQVMEHGEFSIRGSIIDLYPMGCEWPLRIDLFDDEIDTIARFDPDNQRSLEKVSAVEILPAHEFPFDEAAISQFRQAWRQRFTGNPLRCSLYEDVSQGIAPTGIEYYQPLFFTDTALLFDYLPEDTCIVRITSCHQAAEQFWQEVNDRFEQRSYDITRPILSPTELFLQANEVLGQMKSFRQIIINDEHQHQGKHCFHFATTEPKQLSMDSRASRPLHRLVDYIKQTSSVVLLCAETAGRREVLLELLAAEQLVAQTVGSWQAFMSGDFPLAITEGTLSVGLSLENPAIDIITESQLFGQQVQQRRQRKRRQQDIGTMVKSLAELKLDDPIVHIDHGIGRYRGLQTIESNNTKAEYIAIEYADNGRIYVPVTSLDMVTRYSGTNIETAPLHRLGHNKWSREKQKAAEKIRDVAAELLDIYARREAAKGYTFELDEISYQTFATTFPFEETHDQQRAISEVIEDMTSPRMMDRLICGDVGFGKTEVAMRAAFVAASNGKQVAILVPTTLLASQHYHNFQDRFADSSLSIEWLSRMRTEKENKTVLAKLTEGRVDIVIGTHKLLQKSIRFKNLGLLIIDEEHRFGVKQKEILKERRSEIDILSLTATPIPRTLNMAMSHMRDISLISTPPARRLAIKTFVQQRNKAVMREAILREVLRGGQVFFLHNKVETIQRITDEIAELVPEAQVNFAHGQMRERQLEQVMVDFYHHRFNVLVCTTIIENGIDIPTANTIIIDRADRFGLAQLHQLRGRVGRSHHQAYAYLITPDRKAMTRDAIKRLDALTSIEDLGAGFILASHDLEIRGAGELLGEEQSGSMEAIGFNLYMELLERAVKALKSGKQPELALSLEHGTEINLNIPALIPEDYLGDIQLRLLFYKRIAGAKDKEALRELQVEMIERFGLLPQEVKFLFRLTELKLLAQTLKIEKIDADASGGRVLFNEQPNIDPAIIIQLIQKQSNTYKLASNNLLRFHLSSDSAEKRLDVVQGLLQKFSQKRVVNS